MRHYSQRQESPASRFRRLPLLRALALATRHVEARLDEQVRPLGLSTSDAWFLLVLLELGQARTTALARALAVTFSTMTEVGDRLERAGWVTRERDARDRRAVLLRLSPEGNRQARAVSRQLASVERAVSRTVAREQRDGFRQVLEAILRTVEEARSSDLRP